MYAALLVLASAAVGVDWGYRPLPAGGIEYIVQLEPQALDDLAASGGEIVSQVPPELYDVRKFRLTIGKQKLPRGGRVATPAKQQTAADGVQVTPASLTGGGNEHVVELDRASIEQMKREMDLVYDVENVRRYRIRLRQVAAATRVEQTSGTATESSDATASRQAEAGPARSSPLPMPTELESAPPFVPAGARDSYPTRGTPPEDVNTREAAASEAAKPLSVGPAQAVQPAPKTMEPEPLKIDLAPAADSLPRPLTPMPTDPALPPVDSSDKPRSTNSAIPDPSAEAPTRKKHSRSTEIKTEESREPAAKRSSDPFPSESRAPEVTGSSDQPPPQDRRTVTPAGQPADWPPVGPMPPTLPAGTHKSHAAPKSGLAGGAADNPFAAPANSSPTADDVRLSPEAKTSPGTSATSAHQTAASRSDEPAGATGRQGTVGTAEPQNTPEPQNNAESQSHASEPPAGRSSADPFSPLETNPLRGPETDAPRSELRSPPGSAFGAGTAQPPAANPFAAPPSSPGGSGTDNPPASDATTPAFGAFPPLNTPSAGSTANPPGEAAKTGDGPRSVPTTMPDHNDPFPSPFGGAAPLGGASLPGSSPAAKTADGTRSVPAALTGHDDSFPSAFGAPTAAGGASVPAGGTSGAGSFDNPSVQAPLTSDASSGPDRFSGSQPPALPRMGFNDETRPDEKATTDRAAAERMMATTADRREEPAGPAAATPAPADKKPWWALTGALVVLFSSLGGNVYFGWMNWDLRRQYASLLEMFKQQRANKGRANTAG